jgi:hypothetical protein
MSWSDKNIFFAGGNGIFRKNRLNRIECHFTVLRKFAIRNSNYQNHKELATLHHWRNKNYGSEEVSRIENRQLFMKRH